MIQFCGKANPGSLPELKAKLAKVIGDATPEAVARARATTTYRTAYNSETSFTALVDERNVNKICPAPPAAKK